MSTPAIIAVKIDDKLHAVYCHNDGHLYSTGRCLLENYNTQEAAEALVALGDLSSVHPRLAPAPGEAHSFDHPAPGVTVAYHRDRGEDLNPWTPFDLSTGVSVSEIVENLDDSGYVYVFMAGSWYYRNEDGRLAPLTKDNTRAPWDTQEGQEGQEDTQEAQEAQEAQETQEGTQAQPMTLEQLRGLVNPTPVWWEIVGGMWCLACRGSVTTPSGRVYNAFEMPGLFYPYPPAVGAVPATLQTQLLRLFSTNSDPHELTIRIEKNRIVFLDGDKVVGTLGGHEWERGV